MTDRMSSRLVTAGVGPSERRSGADRRSGVDRRGIDLLRETGRCEHDTRSGADRRSGQERRRDRRATVSCKVVVDEIFTPWQMP